MKKLILIALIMSIITGFAVYYYATNLEKSLQTETLPVAIAVKAIPRNTLITSEMITIKQFPVEAVNGLALNKIEEIKGRIAKYDIEANEQILSTRLSDSGAKAEGLSYKIKEGYRAITIRTDEISGVAGRLSKGDSVDVIAMLIDIRTQTGSVSQMILENVEILELGLRKSNDEGQAEGAYSSVTLLVSAEDVLKLNSAISEGRYNLVLRSVLDKNLVNPAPYTPY